MGGRRTTLALVLAVAAICAIALSACGGGDDSPSSTASTEAGTETEATTTPPAKTGKGEGKKGPSKAEKPEKTGAAPTSAGGGKPGGGPEPSSDFKTPGGDNSIQEYGEEAGDAEREEATVVVGALFKALETGNWNEVCGKYLSKGNVEQLEMLSEKVPQAQGKSCSEILSSLNAHQGAGPSTPAGEVGSVRIEDEVAFAIYRGRDGKGYAVPLKQEGGWKLTALAPTPLSGP
jgi:hypothetical protein